MQMGSTATFHSHLKEATREWPEKDASDGSSARLWGDWCTPRLLLPSTGSPQTGQKVGCGCVSMKEG